MLSSGGFTGRRWQRRRGSSIAIGMWVQGSRHSYSVRHIFFYFFSSVFICFTPDIVLFGADAITDWVNGSNLILNGDLIWGGIMVSLPVLPMTIFLLWVAFANLTDKDGRWKRLLLLLFLFPAAAVCTPLYMCFILLAGFARLIKPQMRDEEKLLCGLLEGEYVNTLSPTLRMLEVVGESYPQALLGESPLTCLIQHCSQWSLSSSSLSMIIYHHHLHYHNSSYRTLFVIIIIIIIVVIVVFIVINIFMQEGNYKK